MTQAIKTDIFEKYSIPKAFISLAFPTIISQLIMIIYNYADTYFIGLTNNADAVAGLNVIMPVYIIINALANLFGIGGASLISRYLGIKEEAKAKNTFAFSVWGSVIIATIYSLVLLIGGKSLIYLVGGTDATYEYIYQYMIITMIIGSIPTILNSIFGHLVRSVGASAHASIGMALGGILNIILDPLFMFVILPAGNELAGAAIATLLSNIVATLYFIIYIFKNKNNPVYTLNPKDITFKYNIPKEVLFIGFPAALSTTLAMVSNIFANKLVSKGLSATLQSSALAGLGIAKKINTLAFNICMGITQGMLPFIAYNYASKNMNRMKKGIMFMYGVALSFSIIAVTFFLIFTESLVSFFIKESVSVYYGVKFLKIIAIAVPLCAISFATNTIFQASGKKVFSFILSILRKGLFDIPLMFIFQANIGVLGVLIATPIAETMALFVAVVLLIIFIKNINHEHLKIINKI